MTLIYMVRHAEAEGNLYRRAHGQYDSSLTPKGLRQLDALAERFRDTAVDALYSSDLRRTMATAAAVARYHPGLELQPDPRLREVDLGSWEDQPFGDLTYRYPEAMAAFNDDPARWEAPGAERYDALQRRIRGAVADIAARNEGKTVVCVSHGMAIRALLCDVMGVPSAEVHRIPHGDNTAVSLLEVSPDGAMRVVFCNDGSHLPAALSTFARQRWWTEPGAVDPGNVHFQRLDPAKHPSRYLAFYKATWRAVHGDLRGFEPAFYILSATRSFEYDPDSIVTICRPDGETAGIIELDLRRAAAEGVGWICLCYVEERYRRALLGVQLIGHAVSVCRRRGFHALRLSVFEGNRGAIAFYEAEQFRTIGETEGVSGRLLIMEKEI